MTRNTASENSIGFYALFASGNTLDRNVSTDNVLFGFNMEGSTSGNTLTLNTANGNETGFRDLSGGTGTAGTDNHYETNTCIGNTIAESEPIGLCTS